MNKVWIALLFLVLTSTLALATTRVSLQNGSGTEIGTVGEPLNVSIQAITVDGVDTGIYAKVSSPYPVNLMGVGADGSLYGGPGVVYDKALYSASPSTGKAAKRLWIDVDGLIYGI